MPEAKIVPGAAKVPGTDGEKMSKSYNNTLGLFEDPKELRKKIMRISTDSRPMENAKDPETDHLFQLYRLFATPEQIEELRAIYLRGGFGYGDVKKRLADVSDTYLQPARKRRSELESHPALVKEILCKGAAKARERASNVLLRAERACGLRT